MYICIWEKFSPTDKGDSPLLTNFPTSDENSDTGFGTLSTSSTKLTAGVFRCFGKIFDFLAMGTRRRIGKKWSKKSLKKKLRPQKPRIRT